MVGQRFVGTWGRNASALTNKALLEEVRVLASKNEAFRWQLGEANAIASSAPLIGEGRVA